MKFCCPELALATAARRSGNDRHIEQSSDGTWNVNGCCGGGCFVVTGMKFCPFCGSALPEKPE
jgi:hypothetical protein